MIQGADQTLILVLDEANKIADNHPRRLVLVGHNPVYRRLEETEQWEPHFGAIRVALHQRLVVGQRVIVQEQSRGDVKCNEHVNRIVLVCCEYEENPKHIEHPRERVHKVQLPWCVCKKTFFFYLFKIMG